MEKFSKVFCFVLMFCCFFSFNVMAASVSINDLPPLSPTGVSDYRHYEFVYEKDNEIYYGVLWSGSADFPKKEVKLTYNNSGTLNVYSKMGGYSVNTDYALHKLVDGAWVYQSKSSLSDGRSIITVPVSNLIYSSAPIYDFDGNEVFPVPPLSLHLVPAEIMTEEGPVLMMKVAQAMKVLTMIAVSCLALLISLPLFGKVFRIFQVK